MQRLRQLGHFGKGIAYLAGSTALGQVIAVLSAPLLTRLYEPSAFGQFGAFAALLTIVGVASTLRLEMAIPLPRSNDDAGRLATMAGLCALAVAGLCTVAVLYAWARDWESVAGMPLAIAFTFPVAVLAFAAYQVFNAAALRQERFGVIASVSVTQSLAQVAAQTVAGLSGLAGVGLSIGDTFGRATGSVIFARRVGLALTFARLKPVFLRYRRFPLFLTPSSVLNAAVAQLPILVMGWRYGPTLVGFVYLATRVLVVPVTLVSSAVGQSYFATGARLSRENPEALMTLFRNITRRLIPISFAMVVVVAVSAPILFRLLFGDQWGPAGELAAALSPFFAAQFVLAAIAPTLTLAQRQDLQLIWGAAQLVVGGAVLVIFTERNSPAAAALAYSSVMVALCVGFYIILRGLVEHASEWPRTESEDR